MNARTFLQGCGIGIALTLSYTWAVLAPDHIQGLYLRVLPVASVAGGAALDLIAASLFCWGALVLLEQFDKGQKTLWWVLLTAVIPAVAINSALGLAEVHFPVPGTLALAAVLLIPAVVAWRFWPAGFRRLVAGFRWGYLCVGICIVWVLPEVVFSAVHHQPPDTMEMQEPGSAGAAQSASGQPRIVWLLLDELSYDQTFDHRQPGLKLANFDSLRAESTSFADVQPAGYFTDFVLPALLSGRPVAGIASSMNGALRVREPGGKWEPFDPQATLFGDAERLGWSVGIAGWFNPYCRLFPEVVTSCLWEPQSRMFPGHMTAANSVWQNALAPLGAKFHVDADTRMAAEQIKAYGLLTARGLELVRGGGERFVFVHLPVPHPPGIYDRQSGQIRTGGSYLDNMVLADKTLGAVRAAIAQSAAAKSTILIVSSDHSMRVPTWRGSTSWTPEDERVFGKRFDTRPVLVVHFPGEQAGHTVSVPFAAIRTHAMIEAMLQGKMAGEQELEMWVGAGQ